MGPWARVNRFAPGTKPVPNQAKNKKNKKNEVTTHTHTQEKEEGGKWKRKKISTCARNHTHTHKETTPLYAYQWDKVHAPTKQGAFYPLTSIKCTVPITPLNIQRYSPSMRPCKSVAPHVQQNPIQTALCTLVPDIDVITPKKLHSCLHTSAWYWQNA